MHHLVHIEQVFGYCSFQICALIFIDLTRALTVINVALVVPGALGKAVY